MATKWTERRKGAPNDDDEDDEPTGGNQGGGGNDDMTDQERMVAEAVQKALVAAGIKPAAPAQEQVVVTDSEALAGAIGASLKPILKGIVAELLPDAAAEAISTSPTLKGLAGTMDALGTHIDDHMGAVKEELARTNTETFKSLMAEIQKSFAPAQPVTPTAPAAPVVPTTPTIPVPNGSLIGQPAAVVATTKAAVTEVQGTGESAYELVQKGMAAQQESGHSISGLSELSIAVSAGEAVDPALIARVSAGIASAAQS